MYPLIEKKIVWAHNVLRLYAHFEVNFLNLSQFKQFICILRGTVPNYENRAKLVDMSSINGYHISCMANWTASDSYATKPKTIKEPMIIRIKSRKIDVILQFKLPWKTSQPNQVKWDCRSEALPSVYDLVLYEKLDVWILPTNHLRMLHRIPLQWPTQS